MTISSSLNAGVTGLSVNASKLATISDNIANSKTYGYKRADAEFSALALTSSEGSYTAGGVRVSTYRDVAKNGSLTSTANPLDLAVGGKGMLPVTQYSSIDNQSGVTPLLMTTTGSFQPDSEGIVRTATGLVLMGFAADLDGNILAEPRDSVSGMEPVRVVYNQFAANRTDSVQLGANLPATATQAGSSGDPYTINIEYFDNLGAPQVLKAIFTPSVPATGSSNTWNLTLNDSDSGGASVAEFTIEFDDTAGTGGSILSITAISGGTYDAATGNLDLAVPSGPIAMNVGRPGTSDQLTQLSGAFSPTGVTKNGWPVGSLTGVEIDDNGFLSALYDTGFSRVIYQIPLASVANPNGLTTLDNQAFAVSPDSGPFYLWDAGDGPTDSIIGYAREESTTDIAGELTQLIQTQRAYSSNAKVIQTVDEMLQETTNIKR